MANQVLALAVFSRGDGDPPSAGSPAEAWSPAPLLIHPDHGALLVDQRPAKDSFVQAVDVPAVAFSVLKQNRQRRGFMIWNASGNPLYVKLGGTAKASATDFSFIVADGQMYEPGVPFVGDVSAFTGTAAGTVHVTELT